MQKRGDRNIHQHVFRHLETPNISLDSFYKLKMIPFYRPHYQLSSGHEFQGDPVSHKDLRTEHFKTTCSKERIVCERKPSKQTPCRNTITVCIYNNALPQQHRNNISNSASKLHSDWWIWWHSIAKPENNDTLLTYLCIPQKDPNKQAPKSLFCQRCCLEWREENNPLQLVTSLPEWTGTLGHLGHLTRRNYIKGGIPNFSNHRSHVFFMFPSMSKVEECRGLWWFLRLLTRHRQKCIVSGSFTGAPERWSIWNKKKGKHWWLLTLFQRVIASSSPSIDRRRVGSTYVFTFSKGPTEHQKIKMQFNPTGFSCQRLHCKLAPSQSLLFFCWMPFLEDTVKIPNLFPLQEWYPPRN